MDSEFSVSRWRGLPDADPEGFKKGRYMEIYTSTLLARLLVEGCWTLTGRTIGDLSEGAGIYLHIPIYYIKYTSSAVRYVILS